MRFETKTAMVIPAISHDVTLAGNGFIDRGADRGGIGMDLRPLAEALGQGFGTISMIYAGSDVYMKLPFLKQFAPEVKRWIKIDLQDVAKEKGLDLKSLLQLGRSGDPSQALAYLRATGEVEDIGTEDVRGVATTHYAAVVDPQKVPELSPEESRDRIKASIDQLIRLTGKSTQPIDVWIDGEGLVRRVSIEQSIEQRSETSKTTTTIELYDFNADVNVEVPPADQVSDLADLVPHRR